MTSTRETPRELNLRSLLERVDEIWVRGVLAEKIGDVEPFDVPIVPSPGLVRSPAGRRLLNPHDVAGVLELAAAVDTTAASLLIAGGPGGGKSTLLLRLVEALVDSARADAGQPVPVVLNLSGYDGTASLTEWISDAVARTYAVPARWVGRWIERGRLVLALDGLDELPRARTEACVSALNDFLAETGTPVLLTCRTEALAGLSSPLRMDAAVEVADLPADVVAGAIGGDDDVVFGALGRSPLWVRLVREVYPPGEVPSLDESDTTASGAKAIEALYERYVARALAARGGEDGARVIVALRWLARAMEQVGTSELWLESLQLSWLPNAGSRRLGAILGLVAVGVLLWCTNLAAGMATSAGALSGMVVGAAALVTVLLVMRDVKIRPREALRFSWRAAGGSLPLMVPVVVVASVLAGTAERGLSLGLLLGPALINGVAGGVVASFVRGLRPAESLTGVEVNAGIRQSLRNAGGYGLAVFAGAFALWYAGVSPLAERAASWHGMSLVADYRLANSLTAATFGGTVTAMVLGGYAATMHGALRLVLAWTSPLPLALPRLLERGVGLGLMRRVGGGYAFMHVTLQRHLAGVVRRESRVRQAAGRSACSSSGSSSGP